MAKSSSPSANAKSTSYPKPPLIPRMLNPSPNKIESGSSFLGAIATGFLINSLSSVILGLEFWIGQILSECYTRRLYKNLDLKKKYLDFKTQHLNLASWKKLADLHLVDPALDCLDGSRKGDPHP